MHLEPFREFYSFVRSFRERAVAAGTTLRRRAHRLSKHTHLSTQLTSYEFFEEKTRPTNGPEFIWGLLLPLEGDI